MRNFYSIVAKPDALVRLGPFSNQGGQKNGPNRLWPVQIERDGPNRFGPLPNQGATNPPEKCHPC